VTYSDPDRPGESHSEVLTDTQGTYPYLLWGGPGTYEITVVVPNYEPQTRSVRVGADFFCDSRPETEHVEFRLTRVASTVSLRVSNTLGGYLRTSATPREVGSSALRASA
jgi:hypothetical protein